MLYDQFFDDFTRQLKTEGRYRVFANLERMTSISPRAYWHHDGQIDEVTIWCSNDYMGMSHHEDVIKAMVNAASSYGAGSGGTRNISGSAKIHVDLEKSIAKFHGKQAGLIFSSGYVANEATICTLAKHLPDCVIFSDEKNHASVINGIRHSRRDKFIFRHNDVKDLEQKLKLVSLDLPKIIVFNGVYSMEGDIAPIVEICDLAKKYQALTYIDEVHAVGMYGKTGAGISEVFDKQNCIDIIQGNFAKGFGVVGGYITGNHLLIDFIRSAADGFIFTTSLPPAVAAANLVSIEIIRDAYQARKNFWQNVNYLRQKIMLTKLPYFPTSGHIFPLVVGNANLCKNMCDRLLLNHKIYIQPINYPTVPVGQERLRITVTARHTTDDIDKLVAALEEVFLADPKTMRSAKQEQQISIN